MQLHPVRGELVHIDVKDLGRIHGGAGKRIDALVNNADFAPTFMDAAGLPVPPDMQGRSLLPLLKGETPPDWRTSALPAMNARPVPKPVPSPGSP